MATPGGRHDGITQHLRRLAKQAHDMTVDGEVVTREEALAILLYQKALGMEVVTKDLEGRETRTQFKPEAWAIQLIYERMEGKTANAAEPETTKLTAAERIRGLAKERINALTKSTVGKGPPKVK